MSQFHGALDVAFARIFSDAPERDIVRRTARGFVWVALLLGGVVAAIVLGGLATFLDALVPSSIPGAGTIASIVTSPDRPAGDLGGGRRSSSTGRCRPSRRRGHRIRLPAVIVGDRDRRPRPGLHVPGRRGSSARSRFAGSLAAAFIALAWLSFTFQALLYGAAWVRVRDERAVSAGRCRTGGRTGRWRRVTGRS